MPIGAAAIDLEGDPLPAGVPEAFQNLVKGLGQLLAGAAGGQLGGGGAAAKTGRADPRRGHQW